MPTDTITAQAKDRAAILEHIKCIFGAYIRKDRAAIRNTHTADWTGFQGPSVKIERGLEDYMVNADLSLKALTGTGFELLDTEVQFRGDVAIVYYVARYDYVGEDGHAGSLPLRSIDIYQRDGAGWIQCGSHISVIPQTATWKT